jgi:hypothetical protein
LVQAGEIAVNTLMQFGVYVLYFLIYGVELVRKWPRASRPRALLTYHIVVVALMIVLSGIFFVQLLTHPAEIKPLALEGLGDWVRYGFVVLFMLGLLMWVSEAILSLARRLRQRS